MQAQPSARPRFRQDLVAEPIEDAGARFIDVMDPDSGTVFRFFEVEYSIACAMDGERDVAGIVQWAKEELGLTPSAGEIRTVIATLGDLGYLDATATAAAEAPINDFADSEATSIGGSPMPENYVPTPAASAAGPAVARLALKRTPASGLPAKTPSQPNIAARRDDELAAGVVVGKTTQDMALPVTDFELGASGGLAAPTIQTPAIVDDLELGASGTTASHDEAPAEVFDIPLGVSGPGSAPAPGAPAARDVSLDLSDQVAIGVDDVKEAVRASKVMNAVDLPKDLLAEPEAEPAKPAPAPAPVAAKPPATPPTRRSEPVIPVPAAAAAAAAAPAAAAAKPAAAKPAAAVAKPAAKPAIEAPRAEAGKPVAPAPSQQRRMMLLFVLLLAVAGAFFVWHYNLLGKKPEPVDVDTAPMPPKKITPPPPETEKLAATESPAQDLKPGTIGPIDMIVTNDAQVAAGALIATIGGHERLDKAVADEQQAVAKLPDEIAAFQKERAAAQGAAAIAAADKKLKDSTDRLDAHKATLATKQSELDKYQIKAPVAGKITAVAKVGARVTPADVVAKVTPTPNLIATFKVTPPMTLTSDAPAKLTTQKDGKTIVCAVQVDAGVAKVTCNGAAASDGDAVQLAGQAAPGDAITGAEPVAETPPAAPGSDGSAAQVAPPAPVPAPVRVVPHNHAPVAPAPAPAPGSAAAAPAPPAPADPAPAPATP